MLVFDQLNKGERPLRLLAWAVLGGLLVLALGLWQVQVISGDRYRERQETQSFRTVRMPAMRGKILDRHGQPLAENQPRYRLDMYLDELRPQFLAEYRRLKQELLAARGLANRPEPGFFARLAARFAKQKRAPLLTGADVAALERRARFVVVSNVIGQLNRHLGVQVNKTEDDLFRHWRDKRALPFPLLENLGAAQVAFLTEQGWSIPGVELELVPVRSYPHGPLAAHLLGHLKREEAFDEEERAFDYRLRDYSGATGLEAAYDRQLRGQSGAKSILVNSAGYRHRQGELVLAEPQPGRNLVTTLDLGLQRAAEQSLAQVNGDERGAVVVMDPRTGDVLALASAPAYDPNQWLNGVSHAEYARLMDEKLKPMFNRATYGAYAPGSIFKIVTAMACFDAGVLTAETARHALATKGYYRLGNRTIDDTAPAGEYDFRRAFIRSSNAYFIEHGQRLGLRRLLAAGRRLHLGEKTGLRLGEEVSGAFPAFEDVQDSWSAGNLANVSIGQEITVTPIQMAVLMSAVANGGKVFWPRVVDRVEVADPLSDQPADRVRAGQLRSELGLRREHLDLIRAAMRDDVASDEGTGRNARVQDFAVCGKTGTAEVKQGRRLIDKITWFASYAPYESPRYAVVVMVESGGSGGGTCAPVARRIYEFLRDRERGGAPVVARHTP
jgi:penicillin-binding protein 2